MLYWSDFQVAKAIHKEREQVAQKDWLLKQALAMSNDTSAYSPYFGRLLNSLKRIFHLFYHE